MDRMRQWLCRLTAILRGDRLDADMAEEIRLHLELRAQANIDAGMPPEEAYRAARRQFGGIDRIQETCRDQRGILWLEQLVRDLRYAVRRLAASPAFTLVALLSLAIGIGANTAIFSLIDAVLLRSLPVRDAAELRELNWVASQPELRSYTGSGMGHTATGLTYAGSFSYPTYLDFRDRATGFSEVFAFAPQRRATVSADGRAAIVDALLISGNFFRGYGKQTQAGRPITPADDRPGAAPAAVITHRCWETLFSLDPAALGRTMMLNRHAFTVVGILPRDFVGPLVGDPTDVYVPLSAQPQLAPDWPLASPKDWWLQIMARLAPGASETQARASLEVLFRRAVTLSDNKMERPGIRLEDGSRGATMIRRNMKPTVWMLQAAVGLVLVITCANLATLLLARGAAHRHEMSIRAAIGAGRGRLIRQQLTESLLLALAGGTGGLVFALWLKNGLLAMVAGRLPASFHIDARLDAGVLGFTLGLSVLTAVLFGLIPALRAARVDPSAGLKESSAQAAPRLRLGKTLAAVQVGLSAVLVVTAGLTVQTFSNLNRVDPGFDPENVLVFHLEPGQAGYQKEKAADFFRRLRRSLAAIPGVTAVALSDHALLEGGMYSTVASPARPSAGARDHLQTSLMSVSDSFFPTMRIALVAGRNFGPAENSSAPRAAIVNETFARSLFSSEDPLGRSFLIGSKACEIIGVCRDARYDSLRGAVAPTVYLSYQQHPAGGMYVEMRTRPQALSLAPSVRSAVAAIDPEIPIWNLTTQRSLIENSIAIEKLFASLCSFLALLAVLLSYIGLYGLTAYNVARRTGEFGIRMALGARPQDVSIPILREALVMAITGMAVGIPVALALAQIVRNGLYGIGPYDPATIIGGTTLLLIVAALAAWIPARRAVGIDPQTALRCE